MANRKTLDIPALLAATCDLELEHPIEAVLARHGIPARHSAYEVVSRYQRSIGHRDGAISDYYKKLWNESVYELKPVVDAIADYFEGTGDE